MRTQRNTMLAGIAALALIAGTGFASAQEPQDHNKTPQAKQPQATQQTNKGPTFGKIGQNAHEQKTAPRAAEMNKTNKAGPSEKQAAQTEPRKQGAMARTEKTKTGKTAERAPMSRKSAATERSRPSRQNTAQQRPNGEQNSGERQGNGLEGLQGNAAGGNVRWSEEQRTQIRNTVLNAPNAPRVGNVDFNVAVGTVIPRGNVRIVPLPPTLVQYDPEWRGFLYFVWNDELVIVNPRDMRIVAVVYV